MNGRVTLLLVIFSISLLMAPALAVISPWSDLVVSQISAPLTGTTGYPYAINVSVENHGNATSGLISVGFYLSPDDHLSKNDTFIQVTTGDPIPHGTGVLLPSIDTIPSSLKPGVYHLFAYVEDHAGDEKDLADNTAMLTAPVRIIQGSAPDNRTIARETADIIFQQTNEARIKAGMTPLVWDEALADLARNYAEQMVSRKFFSHTDPDGHDQSFRAQAAGYKAVKKIEGGERIGVSENIAYMGTGVVAGYGYVNPTDPDSIATAIMTGWLKSPGHRKNILDPLSDRFGAGLSWNGEYWYAVQEFF